jgi:hypothetical protein
MDTPSDAAVVLLMAGGFDITPENVAKARKESDFRETVFAAAAERTHPDKGGCARWSRAVTAARETLKS